jgi:hypothetical protein
MIAPAVFIASVSTRAAMILIGVQKSKLHLVLIAL